MAQSEQAAKVISVRPPAIELWSDVKSIYEKYGHPSVDRIYSQKIHDLAKDFVRSIKNAESWEDLADIFTERLDNPFYDPEILNRIKTELTEEQAINFILINSQLGNLKIGQNVKSIIIEKQKRALFSEVKLSRLTSEASF